MIDRKQFLDDAKKQVGALEADLLEVTREGTEIGAALREEYRAAFDAKRTGWSDKEWIDDRIAQAAVAWVLACVFVRFLEDNELIAEARIAGPAVRGQHARDVKDHYFRENPAHSDADYLEWVFEQVAKHPATASVFDRQHNPLWQLPISGDAARGLIEFWRRIDPDSDNSLVHDFRDHTLDTRFLGDLYQDLSDHAKKTYALLQTPEFVEEFILDRTLDPAIEEFGLEETTLIDPTCGSGHFLLGAFQRLLGRWRTQEPGTDVRELVQRTLHAVHGVDINPFAVAIAKFRLMIVATAACGIKKVVDAPAFELNLAVGDSLLHGHVEQRLAAGNEHATAGHWYPTEDAGAALKILERRYHAVVGNPPYITPKDPLLNEEYRTRYRSCYKEYALSAPFMEKFFDLAVRGNETHTAGFVGKITSNSFMKREFGTRVVEEYLSSKDLHAIVDTSGAQLPGHGTPTVILFGRNRPPSSAKLRAVLGIRAEPGTPAEPSQGRVWRSIVELIDKPGAENDFVTVADLDRHRFTSHPWSLTGGRAGGLLERLHAHSAPDPDLAAGVVGRTSADDAYFLDRNVDLESPIVRRRVVGEAVRDWNASYTGFALFPYVRGQLVDLSEYPIAYKKLWPLRTTLWARATFGKKTYREDGRTWWEWHQVTTQRVSEGSKPIICYAEVATHNRFVLSDASAMHTQTAPVVLVPSNDDADYLSKLGVLNSSVACFLLKQVCHCKGGEGVFSGAKSEAWEQFYQFNSTKVAQLPFPSTTPTALSAQLTSLAAELASLSPAALIEQAGPDSLFFAENENRFERCRSRMIALQEELDWSVYVAYGLTDDAPITAEREAPEVSLGERAFEIVLARRLASGEAQTEWFSRHGSSPQTEIPSRWPEWYRGVVQRRIDAIDSDRDINLLERPEYKRRWSSDSWASMVRIALRDWLLGRICDPALWSSSRPLSCARVADLVFSDPVAQAAAEHWAGGDVDPVTVVSNLVADQSVPYVAALRYKESGLATYAVWSRTWDLQRREDAIKVDGLDPATAETKKKREVGEIAKPPAFKSSDFIKPTYWRLRGKLDVPKERFISYPGVETADDPSPVLGWAGWDHEQRAQAIGAMIDDRERNHAWTGEQLTPLLAGLRELLPWLRQWHADIDPTYGTSAADDFAQLYESKLHEHGLTENDLDLWRPPASARGRRARTSA